MKKYSLLIIALCFSFFAHAQKVDTIFVSSVVEEINNSLVIAQTELMENPTAKKYILKSASVNLKTVIDKTGSTGINFLIFKAKKTWSSSNSNSITFNFKEPEKDSSKMEFVEPELPVLARAIIGGVNSFNAIPDITGLEKDSFDIELSFSVSKKNGGGISFDIFNLGIEGDGELANTFVHTIKLNIEIPDRNNLIEQQ